MTSAPCFVYNAVVLFMIVVFQLSLSEDREELRRRNTLMCKDESARRDEETVSLICLTLCSLHI